MQKNEFELKKLVIASDKFSKILGLIQHIFTLSAVVFTIYIIMVGLEQIVKSRPDSLNALAVVIEKLQISSIIGYVVAAGTTLGWVYERKGKKRAYKKLAERRSDTEQNDPYKGSSHLDENGHTPS